MGVGEGYGLSMTQLTQLITGKGFFDFFLVWGGGGGLFFFFF